VPVPRAILFDLDDTILDDTSTLASSWRIVCEDAAARLGGIDGPTLYEEVERYRTWFWSDPERHRVGRQDLRAATRGIVDHALQNLGVADADLAREIAERYRDMREEMMKPFPGAIDALEAIRARGIATALVTNGSAAAQRAKVERFDLARHFDGIFIEGEFGYGKPDERVYVAALLATSCDAPSAWFVGDNLENDVGAPSRLGMHTVWIDLTGDGLPHDAPATPHRIVRGIRELF
jgi:putative hydrolase of the HAD superfamily